MNIFDENYKYKIKLIGYIVIENNEKITKLVYLRTHEKVQTIREEYFKNTNNYNLVIEKGYNLIDINKAKKFVLYNDKPIEFNTINVKDIDVKKYGALTTLLINGVFGENATIYESKYIMVSPIQNKLLILEEGWTATKNDVISDLEMSVSDRLKEIQNDLI